MKRSKEEKELTIYLKMFIEETKMTWNFILLKYEILLKRKKRERKEAERCLYHKNTY